MDAYKLFYKIWKLLIINIYQKLASLGKINETSEEIKGEKWYIQVK